MIVIPDFILKFLLAYCMLLLDMPAYLFGAWLRWKLYMWTYMNLNKWYDNKHKDDKKNKKEKNNG